MGTGNTQPPFDEDAALAELEKLREGIEAARRRREQKVEEFETWMRETRNTARVDRIATIEQELAGEQPAAAARAANRGTDPAAQSSASTAAPAASSTPQWSRLDETFPFEAQRERTGEGLARRPLFYAGVAVLIVAGLLLGQMWRNTPSTAPQARRTAQTTPVSPNAAPAPQTPAPPANAQAPPAGPRKPIEIELTTTRPVWMRVTVDGERRVEREVPSGQRMTFGADRAIALRVGDGGGVRLSVGGKDQGLLGRDGQIAVRSFTK